ncbi:FAD-binding oxidoreductase [Paenarthrobacter nitroguajacolicus]|uniref:FAD-binding oxidoreductase n=1 Tax=Paenarthrobacter nitroguajacolicus TaxID=211146 RepID=UPI001AEB9F33|nr:FAD-binding oxidoreductase [Paenarthrobacter nitroguajacolicus]MDR6639545.1 4-cresol dehydrogenase (hydroxylating) [Paenarthrobacter nitroguajacolicus]
MSEKFFEAVSQVLGPEAVDVSDAGRASYSSNRLPGGDRQTDGIVFPSSTADVSTIVRLAAEHGVSLWPTSTGHNWGMGEFSPVRGGQVIMHLGKRMNRILEVDERLGYAVIEPGVTFRQLRAKMAELGDKFMISGTSGPPDGSIIGNAVDRGAGYTPHFDHFGTLCGMEIVLPNGEIFNTGDGALPNANTRFTNKSGFGPLLDGIFTQSNFGIVTQTAVWLMPRPATILGFAFSFAGDEDLSEIFELVRPLKLNSVVPTLIKVTSGGYGFATEDTYPYDRTNGQVPLPDDIRRELQEKHGTGAWLVSGALYGPSVGALQPTLDKIRAVFEASGKATYISHKEMLDNPIYKIHLDTYSGEPTASEVDMLNWRPGGGATWFLPATPMIGEAAELQHQTSRRILAEHGFEYFVEFVCSTRAARGLHLIIFNRQDPDEVARMNSAYAALVEAYDQIGYPIGRTPTDWQERAMSRLPVLQQVTHQIKAALDPMGTIAPGKYGIS